MNTTTTAASPKQGAAAQSGERSHRLLEKIAHAAHLLPAQGPITAFVHHNTLHAFEELPFHEAVVQGGKTFGCHPYMPEEWYRNQMARGRILREDIEAVLIEDLSDEGDELLGFFGTRYHLRMAILAHPLRTGPAPELRWIIAETDALAAFRSETPLPIRDQLVAGTRRWVMRDLQDGQATQPDSKALLHRVFERFDRRSIESWDDATWESFTLHTLWIACSHGVRRSGPASARVETGPRHRDLLLEVTGQDADRLVHEPLIRFCAAFLDQGFADWPLPDGELGFYRTFLNAYGQPCGPPDRWMRGLRKEVNRLDSENISPLDSLAQSLIALGVDESTEQAFIEQTLLALRGYAGMIWQLESRGDRVARPAPAGSLLEFLAVRLILDRLALEYTSSESLGYDGPLSALASHLRSRLPEHPAMGREQRAFELFQLAQVIGWPPPHLCQMPDREWRLLLHEVEAFSGLHRRRIYHLAYERRYRHQALDAVARHNRKRFKSNAGPGNPRRPAFQLVCCIDDREESFRRHLEEIEPRCETFGAAGFFAVAMYYRGAADAHFTPLCPVIIKPRQYVIEEAGCVAIEQGKLRQRRRRVVGTVTHRAHVGSRTFAGGWIAGVLGSVASIPLVMRILFPRTAAQIGSRLGSFVRAPQLTTLRIERSEPDPGPEGGHVGYTIDEMTGVAERLLRDIGLTKRFSKVVLICGHGSSSLNNPHEAAYDCGACSGGRGGPNARAFAHMANDPRVRKLLALRGMHIPDDTVFVGAYHNTCDDSVAYFDLERLTSSHQEDFNAARLSIDEARARDAHERCRRFESAALSMRFDEALRHAEGRSEDLSQARPECGHATNALCFVGRREWSRGLFLDRRAFLHSYDPDQDDDNHNVLTRILQAVIPVCAGINLEYFFSYIDPTGYGCGTKLPHNITSLLGVMNGAASDLLPGLPWQMVEIHEPMRLLFVIETTPEALHGIIENNEAIARLVRGEWVQLATFEPSSGALRVFRSGRFVEYHPATDDPPVRESSLDWYRGWRDHLGFASISASNAPDDHLLPGLANKGGR